MKINYNSNANIFTKINLTVITALTILKNLSLENKKTRNLPLFIPLNLISRIKLLINLFAGQKNISLTRDQLKDFFIIHNKYISENKYIFLFKLFGISIYGFRRQYLWFISRILLRACFITFKRLKIFFNRYIKNWLNILLSKSDFLIWFKYFLKKFFYRFILKEEIQHSRWIKHATKSELPRQVNIVDSSGNIRSRIIIDNPKIINPDRTLEQRNIPNLVIRTDGITITEEDYVRPDSK